MKCSSSRLVAALVSRSVGEAVALLPDQTRFAARFIHTIAREHEGTPGAKGMKFYALAPFEFHQSQRIRYLGVRLVNLFLVTHLLLFSYSSLYWDTRDSLQSSDCWLSSNCLKTWGKACRSPKYLVGIEMSSPNMLIAVAQRVRAILFDIS